MIFEKYKFEEGKDYLVHFNGFVYNLTFVNKHGGAVYMEDKENNIRFTIDLNKIIAIGRTNV